jgi:hypothetical protein
MVGTSGNAGERSAERTASIFRRPVVTKGAIVCSAATVACTWPPTRSDAAPADPLYGTCTTSVPVSIFTSSMARFWMLPAPGDE